MKNFVAFALLFIVSSAYSQQPKEGIWAGEFDYSNAQPPFTFEISSQDKMPPVVTLINGVDRQILKKNVVEGDSIFISLTPFDAVLRAKFTETEMTGVWRKNYRKGDVLFSAKLDGIRFENSNKQFLSINPKWAIEFKPGTADKYAAVGLFEQVENRITGTVLTEVGDFRFFEGIVDGDSIKMSSFDGVHAFMMVGAKVDTGWKGTFYFDKNYSEEWVAVADDGASIQDPFEIISVDPHKHKPYFDLLGAGSGKNAIDVLPFEGKVVIIQAFGTWCPNSYDQTKFLVDWYKTKRDNVEVVASTYEPNYSKEYGLGRIADYTSDLAVPYDVYLGGQLSKSQAAFSFPFIDKINAFPTLIILDKQGFARYVHSYFNGPATGEYFEAFKARLEEIIDELATE